MNSTEREITLSLPKNRGLLTLPLVGERPLGTTFSPDNINNPSLIFVPGEVRPLLDAGGIRLNGLTGLETVGKVNEQIIGKNSSGLSGPYTRLVLAEEDLSRFDPEQLKAKRIENIALIAHSNVFYPVEVLDEQILNWQTYNGTLRIRWYIKGWHNSDKTYNYFFDYTRRHKGLQGKETVVEFNLTPFDGKLKKTLLDISHEPLTFPTCPSSLIRLTSVNESFGGPVAA